MIDDEDFEDELPLGEEEEEEERRKGFPFFELLSGVLVIAVAALVIYGVIKMWKNIKEAFNHVEAGELELQLERIRFSQYLPDKDGFLVLVENSDRVDFTEANKDNIFGLSDSQKIVPGCYLESELCVINEDSVTFGYWIEVVVTSGAETLLAEDLVLTITTTEGTQSVSLSKGLVIGSETNFIGVVADGESENFTVRIDYADTDTSIAQAVSFDLIVYAVESGK